MSWRALTEYETALLERLLGAEFPGRDAVAQQVRGATVREIDESGSIEFKVDPDAPRANVNKRVPVEGEANDADGVPVSVLLFVVDGRVDELEICKADGRPMIRKPVPDELQVVVYPRGRMPHQ